MIRLERIATGEQVSVALVKKHSASSNGREVWVDESNMALCQVGFEDADGYRVCCDTPGELRDYDRKRIGALILNLRKQKGMTQVELAERSGLYRPHITRIECGCYAMKVDTLSAIARALDCEVSLIPQK